MSTLFDGRYLCVVWHPGVWFTWGFHTYVTLHTLSLGPLEITFPMRGHSLVRWRDVPNLPKGHPLLLSFTPKEHDNAV